MEKSLSIGDIPQYLVDFFFAYQPPKDLPLSTLIKKAQDKHHAIYGKYNAICSTHPTSKDSLANVSSQYNTFVKNFHEVLLISKNQIDDGLLHSFMELSTLIEETGLSIWAHYYSFVYGGTKLLN